VRVEIPAKVPMRKSRVQNNLELKLVRFARGLMSKLEMRYLPKDDFVFYFILGEDRISNLTSCEIKHIILE